MSKLSYTANDSNPNNRWYVDIQITTWVGYKTGYFRDLRLLQTQSPPRLILEKDSEIVCQNGRQ